MNIEFYKNFITVAETGNITIAAEKLNIVQPALSKQIDALEKHYGIKLIEKQRGKRQITLTDAGVDFLRRAQEICQAEASLSLDLQTYKQNLDGTLRISVSNAASNIFMDNLLLPFSQTYPGVNFQIHEEAVSEQIISLKNNLIDVAYANAPLPENDSFNYLTMQKEQFYAVYHKNNTLNFHPNDRITLKELQNLPICCNYGCYNLLNNLCSAQGFSPQIRLISTTGTTATKFAENSSVVAVVSEVSCQHISDNLEKVLIKEENFIYYQTLFWSKQNRIIPILDKFIEFAKNNRK